MLALPYRYGGLGITNPCEVASFEYSASKRISQPLTELILHQNMDSSQLSNELVKATKKSAKKDKDEYLKLAANSVKNELDETRRRYFIGAQEKGASSWLTCLPLKSMGYALNKRDFVDAVSLRYGWLIKDMPRFCACGTKNSVEHTLTCKKGGFIIMRHNAVRDTEASLMKEISKDVTIEPPLLPVGNTQLANGTNTKAHAKLDVSATGIWSIHEKTFFDIRITNPHAASNAGKTTDTLLKENETEKERNYQDRVLQVEKSSFVPLVFTTNGGMGEKCKKFHRQLAMLICAKAMDTYSKVMAHIRTRLRFALLKSTIVAVRGYRGQRSLPTDGTALKEIDFGLVEV